MADKETTMKYGVPELAQALDIQPASVRVALRNHGVEKTGKSYGWATKADIQAVADKIREAAKVKAKAPKPEPAKAEAPKAKVPRKKAA